MPLNQVAGGKARLPGENSHDFVRGLSAIEGLDQGLDDADGSVVGAGIAPGFQIVRFEYVPLAKVGSLVAMRAQIDFCLHGA